MLNPEIFVSIIVPNFNGAAHLEKCLAAALRTAKHLGKPFEILLVDDASRDQSVPLVRERFPEVKLRCATRNRGFSKTCNSGAHEAKGKWLLFLNNDCYLSETYLTQIFEKSRDLPPELFSLMGAIYSMEGRLADAAKFPEVPSGFLWRGIKSTLNVESAEEILPTLFSSGCNILVRRDKFMELGGFDELYSPFYLEDVDLGLSAWRRGWPSYYIPQATCVHEGSSTISKIPSTFVRAVSKRNRWLFHLKHLPKLSLSAWILTHSGEILLGLVFRPHLYFSLLRGLLPRLGPILRKRTALLPNTDEVLELICSQLQQKGTLRYF